MVVRLRTVWVSHVELRGAHPHDPDGVVGVGGVVRQMWTVRFDDEDLALPGDVLALGCLHGELAADDVERLLALLVVVVGCRELLARRHGVDGERELCEFGRLRDRSPITRVVGRRREVVGVEDVVAHTRISAHTGESVALPRRRPRPRGFGVAHPIAGMHVAVLGAGYAGLTVARRLERRLPDAVDITVVDESDTHLVQHELHRVVRRPDLAEVITVPLADVLARAEIRQARVTDVDTDADVATLATDEGEERLEYDYAAVCLGAETAFYGLPGVEEHATPLKRLRHAETIRRDALDSASGEAIVGGGGLSGIQVAGELAALSEAEELDLDVTIVEMADRIAPGFDESFADAVRDELDARGVAVETGATVESADADAVHLADGRSLGYDTFVWAGGIRGPEAADGERPEVRANLRVGDGTFVVGDAGKVVDASGEAVPAAAQTALREAKVAAANIRRLVRGGDDGFEPRLDRYEYDSPGWVVSVGDGAVAQVGPIVMSGEPAKAAKAVIGAGHLGSVGAIGRASDLVRAELGWPSGDDVDLPAQLLGLTHVGHLAMLADPASPGEVQYPFATTAVAAADAFGPDTVDLTPVTRLVDSTHPESQAERVGDALGAGLGAFGSLIGAGARGSRDTETDGNGE